MISTEKVSIEPSPLIKTFYQGQLVTLTLDSGANVSMVSEQTAHRLHIPILDTTHTIAQQADKTHLHVIGEACFTVNPGPVSLYIEALVVKNLTCDVLAGMPFLRNNKVVIDIPGQQIQVCGKHTISMQNNSKNDDILESEHRDHLIRSFEKCVILPGDYNFKTPLQSTNKILYTDIGAFKHMRSSIPQYSALLTSVAQAKISWTEELNTDFAHVQQALKDLRTITIPKPSDQLVIQIDCSVRNRGIGAVIHVVRNGELHLGGYFSAKLKPYQQRWLPCEVEGIAISAAVQNWSKLIHESQHYTQVLSDSKPCIQAYNKLKRGQFSSSSRVTAFLSTLANHRITLHHIEDKSNTGADYQSRHPVTCEMSNCQMCRFIENEDTETANVNIKDILEHNCNTPYTNPNAWRDIQKSSPVLRRVYSHLRHGTRPAKKSREHKDFKRYLRSATLGRNGLIVFRRQTPFTSASYLPVVPQEVIKGLLTALHIKLQHPSISQLRKVFERSFFTLDLHDHIREMHENCDQCAKYKVPKVKDSEICPCSSRSSHVTNKPNQTRFNELSDIEENIDNPEPETGRESTDTESENSSVEHSENESMETLSHGFIPIPVVEQTTRSSRTVKSNRDPKCINYKFVKTKPKSRYIYNSQTWI